MFDPSRDDRRDLFGHRWGRVIQARLEETLIFTGIQGRTHPIAKLAERLLLAADFSECSNRAFENALGWARACEAELDTVHVLVVHPYLEIKATVSKIYLNELWACLLLRLALASFTLLS